MRIVPISELDTLSREIKHPLSKSPTRPKKGEGVLLTHPFLIHIF